MGMYTSSYKAVDPSSPYQSLNGSLSLSGGDRVRQAQLDNALGLDQFGESIRQFNSNLDWEKEQYYGNQQYNSASAQRQRLVEAGYNPMFQGEAGQGSSSTVSSVGSSIAGSLPQPDSTLLSQFSNFMGQLQNLPSNIANIAKVREDTKSVAYQNQQIGELLDKGMSPQEIAYQLAYSQFFNNMENGKNVGPNSESQRNLNTALGVYYRLAGDELQARADQVRELTNGIKIENDFKPQLIQKELDKMQKEINLLVQKAITEGTLQRLNTEQLEVVRKNAELLGYQNMLRKYGISDNDPVYEKMSVLFANGKLSASDIRNFFEGVVACQGSHLGSAYRWDNATGDRNVVNSTFDLLGGNGRFSITTQDKQFYDQLRQQRSIIDDQLGVSIWNSLVPNVNFGINRSTSTSSSATSVTSFRGDQITPVGVVGFGQ